MKRCFLLIVLFALVLLFPGCKGRSALKDDAAKIGDLMCRSIENQNKLRAVNLNDTAGINKLQKETESLQEEMTKLYQDFRKKWGEKAKDQEFDKQFSAELRKAMLNCPYLSKEDREQFEKDLEK